LDAVAIDLDGALGDAGPRSAGDLAALAP
jgi:hypothetical protein